MTALQTFLLFYGMGSFICGFVFTAWYDITHLSAYGNKRKILDLTMGEWAFLSALAWPIMLVIGIGFYMRQVGVKVLGTPFKAVGKVGSGIVDSIERRIEA